MPLIIQFTFEDGTSDFVRIPAEIWSRNNLKTSKVFVFEKPLNSVELDPKPWFSIFIATEADNY